MKYTLKEKEMMQWLVTELKCGVKNYITWDYYSDKYRPLPEDPNNIMLGSIFTVIKQDGTLEYFICSVDQDSEQGIDRLAWHRVFRDEELFDLIEELQENVAETRTIVSGLSKQVVVITDECRQIEIHLADIDSEQIIQNMRLATLESETGEISRYIDEKVEKVVEAVEAEETARIVNDVLLGKRIDSETLARWIADSELAASIQALSDRTESEIGSLTSEMRSKISSLTENLNKETQERLAEIQRVDAKIDAVDSELKQKVEPTLAQVVIKLDSEIVERKESDSEIWKVIADFATKTYVDNKVDSEHKWNVKEHKRIDDLEDRADTLELQVAALQYHDKVVDSEIEKLDKEEERLEEDKQDKLNYVYEYNGKHFAWGNLSGGRSSFPNKDAAGRSYYLNLFTSGYDNQLRFAVTVENTASSQVYDNKVGADGVGTIKLYDSTSALVWQDTLGANYGCDGVFDYNWCISWDLNRTYIEQRDLKDINKYIDVSTFGSTTNPEKFTLVAEYKIPGLGTATTTGTLYRKKGEQSGVLQLGKNEDTGNTATEIRLVTGIDETGNNGPVTLNGKQIATVYSAGEGVTINGDNVISIDVNSLDVQMGADYTVYKNVGGYKYGDTISKATTLRDILIKLLDLR